MDSLLFDLPAITPFGKLAVSGVAVLDGTLEIKAPAQGILAAVFGETTDVLTLSSASVSFDQINGLFKQPLIGGNDSVDLAASFHHAIEHASAILPCGREFGPGDLEL